MYHFSSAPKRGRAVVREAWYIVKVPILTLALLMLVSSGTRYVTQNRWKELTCYFFNRGCPSMPYWNAPRADSGKHGVRG